jgi:hypothetical protein
LPEIVLPVRPVIVVDVPFVMLMSPVVKMLWLLRKRVPEDCENEAQCNGYIDSCSVPDPPWTIAGSTPTGLGVSVWDEVPERIIEPVPGTIASPPPKFAVLPPIERLCEEKLTVPVYPKKTTARAAAFTSREQAEVPVLNTNESPEPGAPGGLQLEKELQEFPPAPVHILGVVEKNDQLLFPPLSAQFVAVPVIPAALEFLIVA